MQLPLVAALRQTSCELEPLTKVHAYMEHQGEDRLGLAQVLRDSERRLLVPLPEMRVLVVEDDVALARHLRRALRRQGAEVTVCSTYEEAQKLEGAFDCAVFDVALPDGSGLDLATQLHGSIARSVFFSGTSEHSEIDRAEQLGTFVNKSGGAANVLRALGFAAWDSMISISH